MTTTNNGVNVTLSGQTGTGTFVGSNSPTFVTPTLGVASATSINFGGGALNAYIPLTAWTPAFTFATVGNLSVSYAVQGGYYLRIGGTIFFQFTMEFTPTFTTSSGFAEITGLPVASNTNCQVYFTLINNATTFTYPSGYTDLVGNITSGNQFIYITAVGSAKQFSTITTSSFTTATQYYFNGAGFYYL
jgi:hypothetical protein